MTKKDKFYITTAILYASRKPHIGNDYEIVFTDSIARFNRMLGKEVFFLTGLDEHGQKIEDLAAECETQPQKYVDDIYAVVKKNYADLNISNDGFIRTTDKNHERVVQQIFAKLYKQGDIYKSTYAGMYCKPCESFWTEGQLVNGCCPDCGRPVYQANEEAYFFKMSKYADKLIEYVESHPEFMLPTQRKKEMMNNFLKAGLSDLCVSRTTFRWGVPVDFDPKHVVYVWIDALVNYITAIGYDVDGASKQFSHLWPADVHIVGKDIFRFHTIYWPIMLMALGLPLPRAVLGHPWLLFANDKMSKSKGNIMYADELAKDFSVDGVRYYLLSQMPYDRDGNVTIEAFVSVYNSELANTLGNLVNRTVAMCNKYFGGDIKNGGQAETVDTEFIAQISNLTDKVKVLIGEYKAADCLQQIMSLARSANKYIDDTCPWVLGKDEARAARLKTVMYNLIEAIRVIAINLSAFLPQTAESILRQIGAKKVTLFDASYLGDEEYKTIEKGEPLFNRIDEAKYLAEYHSAEEKAKAEKEKKEKATNVDENIKSEITIEDIDKIQLKIAEVLTAEKVEKSDKLLKMTVSLGAETRTVVSGIAKYYTPEQMIGKKVLFVANLKPAKLRGITSEGMILCAESAGGEKVVLLCPEQDMAAGCEVF